MWEEEKEAGQGVELHQQLGGGGDGGVSLGSSTGNGLCPLSVTMQTIVFYRGHKPLPAD